jgi:hypothetical protein
VYFEAETPGFTYFGIGGEKIKPVTTTTTTALPPVTTTLPKIEEKKINYAFIGIVLILIIALIVIFLKFFKKKIF